MNNELNALTTKRTVVLQLTGAALMAIAFSSVLAAEHQVVLSGAQEVPAVTTPAEGNGTLVFNDDMTVSGSVMTKELEATMAHIHQAPAGKNGPPIIPLEKKSENEWVVPAGAKLTEAQFQAYKAGDLYVNVHSNTYKGGEIRGQIEP